MTDEQAQGEAFGNVNKFPKVQGRCPSCGRESLFLGDGGYVTCSIIGGCANPSAAHEALAPSPRGVGGDEREAVARAIRSVPIGPFGPNSLHMLNLGAQTHLNSTESLALADAALSAIPKPTVSAEQVEALELLDDAIRRIPRVSSEAIFERELLEVLAKVRSALTSRCTSPSQEDIARIKLEALRDIADAIPMDVLDDDMPSSRTPHTADALAEVVAQSMVESSDEHYGWEIESQSDASRQGWIDLARAAMRSIAQVIQAERSTQGIAARDMDLGRAWAVALLTGEVVPADGSLTPLSVTMTDEQVEAFVAAMFPTIHYPDLIAHNVTVVKPALRAAGIEVAE